MTESTDDKARARLAAAEELHDKLHEVAIRAVNADPQRYSPSVAVSAIFALLVECCVAAGLDKDETMKWGAEVWDKYVSETKTGSLRDRPSRSRIGARPRKRRF